MKTRKNYRKRINFDREKKIEFTLIIISLIFIVIGFLSLQTEQQIGINSNTNAPKITGKVVDEFTINAFSNCAADTTNGIWNITSSTTINLNQTCDVIHVTSNAILTVNNSAYKNNTIKLEANSITIDAGAAINATGTGYPNSGTDHTGNGPGGGTKRYDSEGAGGGGSYGGVGGSGGNYQSGEGIGGGTYGSITQPILPGSAGGSGAASLGGSGGGAILFNVSGTFKHNGIISTDGNVGGPACNGNNIGGGGSGGSIWVIATTFQGSGNLTAKGGGGRSCPWGDAGGGGGRIAVNVTTNSFTGQYFVYGGRGGNGDGIGGAGTLYIKDGPNYYGNLVIDNNYTSSVNIPTRINQSIGYIFGNITVKGGARVDLGNRINLTMDSTNLLIDDNSQLIQLNYTNITALNLTNLTIYGTLELSSNYTLNKSMNLFIGSNGILRHTNDIGNQSQINLTVNNLTIIAGGIINTTGAGYINPGVGFSGQGAGGGTKSAGDGAGGGGGYGGDGGDGNGNGIGAGGSAYGSATRPIDLGSAGGSQAAIGGNGGGTIILNVSGTFLHNGTIQANGLSGRVCNGNDAAGGGSGGSVWITANTFQGNGTINAKGGNGIGCGWTGGGGSGGRISYSCSLNTFAGAFSVAGGSGANAGDTGSLNNGCNNVSVINLNRTIPPAPSYRDTVQIIANVTGENAAPGDIRWVNFTLIAPNGTKVIDHVNGTLVGAKDNWSSTSYLIQDNGTWTWTVNVSDNNNTRTDTIGSFKVLRLTSNGTAFYEKSNTDSVAYRNWTGIPLGVSNEMQVNSPMTDNMWISSASHLGSDLGLVATIDDQDDIAAVFFKRNNVSVSTEVSTSAATSQTTQATDVAFETHSGTGVVFYAQSQNQSVFARTIESANTSWSGEIIGPIVAPPTFNAIIAEANPSDNKILVMAGQSNSTSTNELGAVIWDNGAFDNSTNLFLGSGIEGTTYVRAWDGCWLNKSTAIVTWCDNAASACSYRLFGPNGWGSELQGITATGASFSLARMDCDPSAINGAAVLALLDITGDVHVQWYNGTNATWDYTTEITTTTDTIEINMDIAYQNSTGKAVMVAEDDDDAVYWVWNNNGTGSAADTILFSESPNSVELTRDPYSPDLVAVMIRDTSNDVNLTFFVDDEPNGRHHALTTSTDVTWGADDLGFIFYGPPFNYRPVISSNFTSPSSPNAGSSVQIYANVTDRSGDRNIKWANFTLIAPNGTKVIDHVNGTLVGAANNWSSTSYTVSDLGNWTWTVNTTDGNNNDNDIGTFEVSGVPTINSNGTIPVTPVYNDSVQIWANVTDTTNDIKWVNFTLIAPNGTKVINHVNGTIYGTEYWNSTTYSIDAVGIWVWTVNASDGSSTDNDIGTFTINDTTNPSITLTNPTNATSTLSTSITFNATLTDNLNLLNTSIYGNWTGGWHRNQSASIVGTSNNSNFTVTNLLAGTYLWNIQACDNSSNCDFATSNFTITINTAPVINSNITSPSTPLVGSSVQIIANVSDADGTPSNLQSVNFTLRAPNGTKLIDHINGTLQGSDNWSSTTYTIDAIGNWTWTINVTDTSGGTDNDIGIFNITDPTLPTISSLTRRPETITTATSVTLNATITDDIAIDTAIITEDSSGSWKNYSITNPVSNIYSFSLHSANFSQSQTVQYRWYANDTSENTIASSLTSFVVQSTQTQDTPSGSPGGSGSGSSSSPSTAQTTQPGTSTPTQGQGTTSNDQGQAQASTAEQGSTTQATLEQPTTVAIPQIDLAIVGIQSQGITPEITNILSGFVQSITTEVNQETTTVKHTEDGVKLQQQETKLGINIDPTTKKIENLKLDLGIIKEIKVEQPIEFEENYFDTITRSLEGQLDHTNSNLKLLLNKKVTNAQLQVKEVLIYAILPLIVVLSLFGFLIWLVYRKKSRKYQFLRLVRVYNVLINNNRKLEAYRIADEIRQLYILLPKKHMTTYSNIISEIDTSQELNELEK